MNHRPVYGIGKNNIEDAFKALIEDADGEGGLDGIHRDMLYHELENNGEEMSRLEIEKIFEALTSDPNLQTCLPEVVTSDQFAEEVLGFEEVDEAEDEEAGGDDTMGQSYMSGSAAAAAAK